MNADRIDRTGLRGGMRMSLLLLLAALLFLIPPASEGEAGVPPANGGVEPRAHVRLTDGIKYSRSARVYKVAAIRAGPSYRARSTGRLRRRTEDGFAEVYQLLVARFGDGGVMWVRLRIPGRPNGRTGWVPRDALGPFVLTKVAVIIDRRRRRAIFHRRGRAKWSVPVGIGAPGSPTPRGRFWVREQFPVKPGGLYGSYAFGTSAYSRLSDWPGGGVVGIHGTNQPWLIPGRPSHGCVRMKNRHIRRLAKVMPNGAPVIVR